MTLAVRTQQTAENPIIALDSIPAAFRQQLLESSPLDSCLPNLVIVRLTHDIFLKSDFSFSNKNATVVIEHSLRAPGCTITIEAKNVVMCPSGSLEADAIVVKSQGPAIFLNTTTKMLQLKAKRGDVILGNAHASPASVSGRSATVFGFNWPSHVSLHPYRNQIMRALEAIPSNELPPAVHVELLQDEAT